MLGLEIVVEGTVVLRPLGRPLRIEIDHAAAATARDLIWKRTPRDELAHERPALPSSGLGAFFGRWPGDEDDEQVLAALRALS